MGYCAKLVSYLQVSSCSYFLLLVTWFADLGRFSFFMVFVIIVVGMLKFRDIRITSAHMSM